MVCLNYILCLRYTILVGNPRYHTISCITRIFSTNSFHSHSFYMHVCNAVKPRCQSISLSDVLLLLLTFVCLFLLLSFAFLLCLFVCLGITAVVLFGGFSLVGWFVVSGLFFVAVVLLLLFFVVGFCFCFVFVLLLLLLLLLLLFFGGGHNLQNLNCLHHVFSNTDSLSKNYFVAVVVNISITL